MPDPNREPRALVWILCDECHQPLVPVELVVTGRGVRRVIRLHNLVIYSTHIQCPECGTVRDFRSREIDVENGGG